MSNMPLVKQCCVCWKVLKNGKYVEDKTHDHHVTPTTHGYCHECTLETMKHFVIKKNKESHLEMLGSEKGWSGLHPADQ
jgi:hypothetical protein